MGGCEAVSSWMFSLVSSILNGHWQYKRPNIGIIPLRESRDSNRGQKLCKPMSDLWGSFWVIIISRFSSRFSNGGGVENGRKGAGFRQCPVDCFKVKSLPEMSAFCKIWQTRTTVHEKWWSPVIFMRKFKICAESQFTSDANKIFPARVPSLWFCQRNFWKVQEETITKWCT